jgi:hypothetical protein
VCTSDPSAVARSARTSSVARSSAVALRAAERWKRFTKAQPRSSASASRRCRRTAQEIRPDRVERLDHGLAFGKVGARYGSWTDREAGEIEAGELVGE